MQIVNNGNCINCQSKNIEIFYKSINNSPFLKNKNTLICRECGLIYKDIKSNDPKYLKALKTDYYDKYNIQKLIDRSKNRIIFDKFRAKHYLKYLNKNINLNKKKVFVDIGGGEGWFANYIKENYPMIDAYNIEPDSNAIKVGRKIYPKINHICSRLEDISKFNNKIDIMTYWGGFYRTSEPLETLKKLKEKSSQNIDLFFSLPYTFDNPKFQHNHPYMTIDDILGKNSLIYLNEFYLIDIVKKIFSFQKIDYMQNLPFKKKIPFIHFNDKSENKKKIRYNLNYNKNINFLKKYCSTNTIKNINKFIKQNKIKKIILWYNLDQLIIKNIFKKIKNVKILYIHEEKWQFDDENTDFEKIYTFKADAFIIGDIENSKTILNEIKTRLHLDETIKIVTLNNSITKSDNYIKIGNDFILNKILTPEFI